MEFYVDLVMQPALVGLFVLGKNVLYDHFMPDNPHVWIDVGTNVFAKLVATFATLEFIVPKTGEQGVWVEPILHGVINGGIKHQFINTNNLNAASFVRNAFQTIEGQNVRVLPRVERYTFNNGFMEGAGYNLASKLLTVRI